MLFGFETGMPYFGLFVGSFLAATILPLTSEGMLAAVLALQANPVLALCCAVAGNCLGATCNYGLGAFAPMKLRMKAQEYASRDTRGRRWLQRSEPLALFFSFVPIVGDPLTIVAGVLRISFWRFATYVYAGRIARYIAVVALGNVGGLW